MQWSIFLVAVGLLFVFEGILPFLSPDFWRRLMLYMITQSNRSLRVMGLVSMLIGLTLVTIARGLF